MKSKTKDSKSTSDAGWFAAFEANTNQKRCTQRILTSFLNKLLIEKEKVHLLDVGCASGVLAAGIIQEIGKERVEYTGMDAEASVLEQGKRLFFSKNINGTFVQGNCFADADQKQLPSQLDIILLSHIAYYASDLSRFTENYTCHLGTQGIAIFIHDAEDSDINQLRRVYQACVILNTAAGIEEYLKEHRQVHAFTYQTLLQFPSNMDDLWDVLKRVSYDKRVETHIPNFLLAKNLLEFVVQQPLESLQEKGKLHEYLNEVKGKLDTQDNCLHIRSRLHLALGKEYGQETLPHLNEAIELLQREIESLKSVKIEQGLSV